MKKLLFLLLLPAAVNAQKISVSALGGVARTSLLNSISKKLSDKNSYEAYGALQVSIQHKKYSLGIRGEVYKIKAINSIGYFDPNGAPLYFTITANGFNPGINFSIFGNRDMRFGKSIVYTGFNLGYLCGSSENSYNDLPVHVGNVDRTGNASGLTFGFQIGYKYKITNHVSIVAELSPRYVDCLKIYGTGSGKNFNALIIPVAAGISFSF